MTWFGPASDLQLQQQPQVSSTLVLAPQTATTTLTPKALELHVCRQEIEKAAIQKVRQGRTISIRQCLLEAGVAEDQASNKTMQARVRRHVQRLTKGVSSPQPSNSSKSSSNRIPLEIFCRTMKPRHLLHHQQEGSIESFQQHQPQHQQLHHEVEGLSEEDQDDVSMLTSAEFPDLQKIRTTSRTPTPRVMKSLVTPSPPPPGDTINLTPTTGPLFSSKGVGTAGNIWNSATHTILPSTFTRTRRQPTPYPISRPTTDVHLTGVPALPMSMHPFTKHSLLTEVTASANTTVTPFVQPSAAAHAAAMSSFLMPASANATSAAAAVVAAAQHQQHQQQLLLEQELHNAIKKCEHKASTITACSSSKPTSSSTSPSAAVAAACPAVTAASAGAPTALLAAVCATTCP